LVVASFQVFNRLLYTVTKEVVSVRFVAPLQLYQAKLLHNILQLGSQVFI
jgi:hypothetical protein